MARADNETGFSTYFPGVEEMTEDEIFSMAVKCYLISSGNREGFYSDALIQFARMVAEKALSQPEQEPVAWLITDENINSIQIESIQRLIDRARHAHMTDIKLRINGQDEWFQADWLKHLTRATPPQRKPLTNKEKNT
jgi:hypothetical protein